VIQSVPSPANAGERGSLKMWESATFRDRERGISSVRPCEVVYFASLAGGGWERDLYP